MVQLNDAFVKLVAVIVVIILAIVGIVWVIGNMGPAQQQPNIGVTLQTFSGKTGELTLNLKVNNTGGNAKEVVVSVSSLAFTQASTEKIDLAAGQVADVSCKVKVNDVECIDYPVTISYSFNGGASQAVTETPMFHVMPAIVFADQHWYWPSLALSEKSHIGPNDLTTLYFKIKSSSSLTYTNLTMSAASQLGTMGLTITPSAMDLDALGPTGTSREYAVEFKSTSMPPGTYNIAIRALSGEYEAAILQVTLWVDGNTV